jgi:hypothetical protein
MKSLQASFEMDLTANFNCVPLKRALPLPARAVLSGENQP